MIKHIGLLGILVVMNGLWAREYFTVTETNWIAYPEAFEKGIEKQRFFRKEFTVREGLVSEGFSEDSLYVCASLGEATDLLKTLVSPGDTVLFENDLPDNYTE